MGTEGLEVSDGLVCSEGTELEQVVLLWVKRELRPHRQSTLL